MSQRAKNANVRQKWGLQQGPSKKCNTNHSTDFWTKPLSANFYVPQQGENRVFQKSTEYSKRVHSIPKESRVLQMSIEYFKREYFKRVKSTEYSLPRVKSTPHKSTRRQPASGN
jgi:hypothetical protein